MLNGMMRAQSKDVYTDDKKENAPLEVLVEKAAKGDRDALYILCERIARDVLFRATHIMGNQTDAKDATQEILIRVCTKIRDLRDPKAFNVWLNKIISNEVKRYVAENARRGAVLNIEDYLESIMEENDDFLPQECSENVESREALMEIISGLPLRQREAVIFHYYDGLSVTETAEAMNVTRQSASEYIALSREKIRREFQKRELGTVNLNSASALPMASLLAGELRQEAEKLAPASEEWLRQAVIRCKEYILAAPAAGAATGTAATGSATAATAASQAPFGLLMGAFATVFTAASLFVGISLGGAPQIENNAPQIQMAEISIEGKVVFSGGVDYGGDTAYVNPGRAEPGVDSISSEVTTIHWWITEAGNEDVLYSGEGGIVEDELVMLREKGADGEYMLYFRLEDEAGAAHRLGRNFYILTKTVVSG